MKILLTILLLAIGLSACQTEQEESDLEKWKAEIIQVEKDFAEHVANEGMHDAFVTYAADDAVLQRNNRLVEGKVAIHQFYDGNNHKALTWAPSFIEVSSSGDLAYTYGDYTFTREDSLGNEVSSTGTFHTVWKRQEDGSWKYVWD